MIKPTVELQPDAHKRVLATGWRWVTLDEVCEKRIATVDPRKSADQEFVYVDISAVDNGAKRIVSPTRMRGGLAPSRARQVVHKDDVIVATTRPNLNAVALVSAD
jgi:type I restriction enzyme S subunit